MFQREEMGRLAKWFFGLPLIFVIYLILSMAMPVGDVPQRLRIVFNIISYAVFIMVTVVVVTGFLKFPFRKMITGNGKICVGNLLVGFASMFALSAGTTFIWMAFRQEDFTYTLQSGWPLDFFLAFILLALASFLEEIICRSYVAYFLRDELETRKKQRLLYCLASAILFTILHFQNPEVSGSDAMYSMAFYFIMGFALMAVTFKTGGIEAAVGIHFGNNLVSAWLFTYPKAALITNAVYTHRNNIGPWMVVQAVLCVALSCAVVLLAKISSERSRPCP